MLWLLGYKLVIATLQTSAFVGGHARTVEKSLVTTKPIKFRFAPSPNGLLHLGHAYSALKTFDLARQLGGTFLLRIEDIDVGRSRGPFVTAIKEDLGWLGLSWPEPVLVQSKRFPDYRQAAQRLQDMGVIYPCAATRIEIQAAVEETTHGRDPDGAVLYPGRGKVISDAENNERIKAGNAHAYRLDMARAIEIAAEMLAGTPLQFTEMGDDGEAKRQPAAPAGWGDVVIVRKDVPTSYHLAVVIDDAYQGISHVTRGRDLFFATDIQRLLQVLLELPEPIYHHHALILDDTGKKLSKSRDATSLQFLRQSGKSPDDIAQLIERALNSE